MTRGIVAVVLLSCASGCPASGGKTSAGAAQVPGAALFEAKLRLLDQVDDAVLSGKPEAFAALVGKEDWVAACGSPEARRLTTLEVADDCRVGPGEEVSRVAINVGTRADPIDAACALHELERSELFYRVGDRSLKVSVWLRAVGDRVFLSRIRCHRSLGSET